LTSLLLSTCAGAPVRTTLTLHDALPIWTWPKLADDLRAAGVAHGDLQHGNVILMLRPGGANLSLIDYDGMFRLAPPGRSIKMTLDRKSTRLNSSHVEISYAVFCLKKKKQ